MFYVFKQFNLLYLRYVYTAQSSLETKANITIY